jgi:hypothetical protein
MARRPVRDEYRARAAVAAMLGLAAISRCRRVLYSALRLTMVETALPISASRLPRMQPAATSCE